MDPLEPRRCALLTDLYEITMAAAWWEHGYNPKATFELSFRRLPPGRGYVLYAGIEQVAQYLLDFRFQDDQIRWLKNLFVLHNVRDEFWEFLAGLRFTGDLWAPPEGTPVFANEPLLRVTAPLVEAQLAETYVLSMIGYQSTVATKAARLIDAAGGKPVVDYGGRRGQGPGASVLAARAAYLAGAAGSSCLEAGQRLGVPMFGTMAHSFVMSYGDELEAFRAYQQVFPDSTTLLLDTYDTVRAVHRAIDLGKPFKAVRLDSGDLATLAREVRQVLDQAGLERVKIVASGELDESRLQALAAAGAPIDSYGVGGELVLSPEAPNLNAIYKLVAIEQDGETVPRLKVSGEKSTLPGIKQVYRRIGSDGLAKGDLVALASESQLGAAVLSPVLKDGKPAVGRPGLESIRDYRDKAMRTLPPAVRRLQQPEEYPVTLSEPLAALAQSLRAEVSAG